MQQDVIVIGAGAVGLSVTRALVEAGMSVAVLEAGRSKGSVNEDLLSHVTADQGHEGVRTGWCTGPGGTTRRWGGQLWAWEDFEFAARGHVDAPPWPVNRTSLTGGYERFLELVRVTPGQKRYLLEAGRADPSSPGSPPPPGATGAVSFTKFSTWLSWRRKNVFRALWEPLSASRRAVLRPGSVVVEIEPTGASEVRVTTRSTTGELEVLRARRVVLAAGTLGNIRLLQQSQLSRSPWVGRGFMDHVSARHATFEVVDPRRFAMAAGGRYRAGSLYTPRYCAEPTYSERLEQLNALGLWELELPDDSAFLLLRDVLRLVQTRSVAAVPVDLRTRIRSAPGDLLLAVYFAAVLRRRPVPKNARVHLRVQVEQPPRFSSSAEWDVDRGASRGPLSLSWGFGREEVSTFRRFGDDLLGDLDPETIGLRLVESGFEPDFRDTNHMMGGARAGRDVDEGVVDADLLLHGADTVAVAGASAFPTGGVANPTMTAAAWALRATRAWM